MHTVSENPYFQFRQITGIVLEAKSWSETHVSGGGGGGSHGVAHINSVKSTVVTQGEIWVRDEDGQEHHLRYSGTEIPTRNGHIITALFAKAHRSKKDELFPVAYYNHTTSTLTKLTGGIDDICYQSLPLLRHGGFWLGSLWFILLISAFFARHVGKAFESLLILAFVFWFISAVITGPQVALRKNKMNKMLDEHFQSVPRVDASSYETIRVAPAA